MKLKDRFEKIWDEISQYSYVLEKHKEAYVMEFLTAICEQEGHVPVLSKEWDKLYENKCVRCGQEGGVINAK